MSANICGVLLLKVAQVSARRGSTERVKHSRQVDYFLRDGTRHRWQQAKSGKQHPHTAQDHSSYRSLESNRPRSSRYVHEFIHFAQRRVHDHSIRRLCSYIAVLAAKSDAGRSGEHRRCIIDSIADKKCLAPVRFFIDQLELFFRSSSGIDVLDSHNLCQMFNLRLPVAGEKDHLVGLMTWAKVANESAAFRARFIVKAQQRSKFSVQHDEALQA